MLVTPLDRVAILKTLLLSKLIDMDSVTKPAR